MRGEVVGRRGVLSALRCAANTDLDGRREPDADGEADGIFSQLFLYRSLSVMGSGRSDSIVGAE